MPGSDIPSNDFLDLIYFDKWVHIGLFGFLTFFWQYPFLTAHRKSNKEMLVIPILAFAYGIAMEFVQKYFTTTRTFDVTDIMADATGVIIAMLIFKSYIKK
jgi:VanZ family protein